MTEESKPENRSTTPSSDRFLEHIMTGWDDPTPQQTQRSEVAEFAAARRLALAEQFPGERLVIRAGDPVVRANDTFYPFRADSNFAYLTGWGAESEPGAV